MIKHLIIDIDGVLTTGHFFYSEQGKMFKVFGPHDKDGVDMAHRAGLTIDFVTADASGFLITCARLTDWKIDKNNIHLISAEQRLQWITERFNVDEVAYIGDGIHDAPILLSVSLGIAPKSARREAIAAADFVTEGDAGSGAVLDAVLHLLKINQ